MFTYSQSCYETLRQNNREEKKKTKILLKFLFYCVFC